MKFIINPQIFEQFPGTLIGIVVAYDINNKSIPADVQTLLNKQQTNLKEKLSLDDLKKQPTIISWQEAYKKFGAKPKEHLSSIENLIQRVLKGQTIKSINPLVDLYNIISLKYLLPAGGEDLDTIQGNIELTIASEHEKPVILLGEKESRTPLVGEVIYKDENGAICRRWNWKEADRTKLTSETKNAFFVVEALPPVSRETLVAALHELATLIEKFCGGTTSVAILDKEHSSETLKQNNEYCVLQPKQIIDFNKFAFKNNTDQEKEISGEHAIRVQKVQELRKEGREPWPNNEPVTVTCIQVIEEFNNGNEGHSYAVAGRIMTKRGHGKTVFAHIQDRSGRLQIYLKLDQIGQEQFSLFERDIDSGDIIWCEGTSFKTKTGEITLNVIRFKLLSKCLHPLPEKFHGITDIETKYRHRYLDLMTNEETRERFKHRTTIIKSMRDYLDRHDFLEVETPMLHPIPGGAAARPFITHHNALDSDFYLRIAPELYLKKLVVGGFERVYEINRNFRNEGISTRHNPEFTMLEFYMAYQDYHFIMQFVETMLREMVQKTCGSLQVRFGEHLLDFSLPFKRINAQQALIEYAKLTPEQLTIDTIDQTLKHYEIVLENKQASHGQKIFALFEKLVEKALIQPTFIIDFPIEISPLSKRDSHNPHIAARFELFIAGMEISNGFNELNDPFDQAERFKEQARAHAAGDSEAMHYDADYIHALEYGLPPTVGVGIGIDRLVMLLTNTTSIKEVILFPTLKKVQ